MQAAEVRLPYDGWRICAVEALRGDVLRLVCPSYEEDVHLLGYAAPTDDDDPHLAHAARLRLHEVLELVELVTVEVVDTPRPRSATVRVKLKDGGWCALVPNLVQEGWGVAWDGRAPRPKFSVETYPCLRRSN